MEQRSSQEKLTNRRKRIVHNRQHKMAVRWCQMSDCFPVQCKTDSLCRTAFLGETPKKRSIQSSGFHVVTASDEL